MPNIIWTLLPTCWEPGEKGKSVSVLFNFSSVLSRRPNHQLCSVLTKELSSYETYFLQEAGTASYISGFREMKPAYLGKLFQNKNT